LRYVLKWVESMVKNNKKILWAVLIGSIVFVILFHYVMLSPAHSSNLSIHVGESKVLSPLSLSHGSNPNMFPLFG